MKWIKKSEAMEAVDNVDVDVWCDGWDGFKNQR